MGWWDARRGERRTGQEGEWVRWVRVGWGRGGRGVGDGEYEGGRESGERRTKCEYRVCGMQGGPTIGGSVAGRRRVRREVDRVEAGMVMGGDVVEGEEVVGDACAVYGTLMGGGAGGDDEIHDVRGRRTGWEDGGTFEKEAVGRDEGPQGFGPAVGEEVGVCVEGVGVERGGCAHLELGSLHGGKQKGSRDGWEGSVFNECSKLGDALFIF